MQTSSLLRHAGSTQQTIIPMVAPSHSIFRHRGDAGVMASAHWPRPAKACSIAASKGGVRLKTVGQILSLFAALLCLGLPSAGAVTLDSSVAVTDPATLQVTGRGWSLSISLLGSLASAQRSPILPISVRGRWPRCAITDGRTPACSCKTSLPALHDRGHGAEARAAPARDSIPAMSTMAERDHLTGLVNRRMFLHQAAPLATKAGTAIATIRLPKSRQTARWRSVSPRACR